MLSSSFGGGGGGPAAECAARSAPVGVLAELWRAGAPVAARGEAAGGEGGARPRHGRGEGAEHRGGLSERTEVVRVPMMSSRRACGGLNARAPHPAARARCPTACPSRASTAAGAAARRRPPARPTAPTTGAPARPTPLPGQRPWQEEGFRRPFLDTINRMVLDFDFEKACSVTGNNFNVRLPRARQVLQGAASTRGVHASLQEGHHVYMNPSDGRVPPARRVRWSTRPRHPEHAQPVVRAREDRDARLPEPRAASTAPTTCPG